MDLLLCWRLHRARPRRDGVLGGDAGAALFQPGAMPQVSPCPAALAPAKRNLRPVLLHRAAPGEGGGFKTCGNAVREIATLYRHSRRLGIGIGAMQVWIKTEKRESLVEA